MTLNKLIQLRKGVVSVKVFRDQGSGKLLFSLDKDMGSRKLMGPLFAEDELYEILNILLDYDEWESGAFHGKPNRRVYGARIASDAQSVNVEISAAITEAAKAVMPPLDNDNSIPAVRAVIQTLTSFPEYTYVHTCPKCGCHVASESVLPGGSAAKLCAWCSHVYHIEGVQS